MKMKEKQKKRKAYEPKLTQEELMDSSTFKRFLTSIDNILENLEDVDFTTMGKYLFGFRTDTVAVLSCESVNPSTLLYFVMSLCNILFNISNSWRRWDTSGIAAGKTPVEWTRQRVCQDKGHGHFQQGTVYHVDRKSWTEVVLHIIGLSDDLLL